MTDPLLGRTIAQRYRLISLIGTGKVSAVYLGRHVMIERISAIKLIEAGLGNDPAYRERFLREARAVNRINHPNIVEISDYGEAEGRVYLVMEYVPGEPLSKILERGRLGYRRAAELGRQIAEALGRAHQMSVIHRDLKPSSVLVVGKRDRGPEVKLTDFGVADERGPTSADLGARGLPSYAAPEHRHGDRVDPRCDLFSLGALLYEATTGTPPFLAVEQPLGAPRDLGYRAPPRLRALAPDTPPFFEDVVTTLLAPDPDDRPRDAFEVADLLRRALEDDFSTAPPRSSEPPLASLRPPAAPTAEPAPPSPWSPRVSGAAVFAAAPLDRIAPLAAQALARIERQTKSVRLSGPAWSTLDEARKLCAMMRDIGEVLVADSRAIEASQAAARAARADLGRRIDELARERSKTLGWAGTIAERTFTVQTARLSGEHSIPTIDALIWEQAALEQEEDRAREKAAELGARMRALQAELDRLNEAVDHELLVTTAGLEGRAAALRTLSTEAAQLLAAIAAQLDLDEAALFEDAPPSTLADAPPTLEDPRTLEAARGEPISTVRASPPEVEPVTSGSAFAPSRRGA
ncbi:MAG: serine/threonine-protein kinase [Byssovorax sp.]